MGLCCGFVRGAIPNLSQRIDDKREVTRVIEFAAIGVWSEVGSIGFDEEFVARNGTCRLSYTGGVGEGERARKRDIPTASCEFVRHLGRAAVTVKNAFYIGITENRLKAIAVRFAVVNDDGQGELFGKLHFAH